MRLINGPEALRRRRVHPRADDVRGFWVAAGFCAHGLAGAGGMGKLVAEWIVEETPSLDVWHMDSRRFGAAYRTREYTVARRPRSIRPTTTSSTRPRARGGTPSRLSPAYPRLEELGASFGEKSGWERANWFEPNARTGTRACAPTAGPAGTGRPPSLSSTVRAARRRPSSTSRRSRRSRCPAREPPSCSSGSVTTGSRGTSVRSPTRRC